MVLGIYGSGGAGREAKEIAEQQKLWSEIVFIDDTVEAGVFKGIKRVPFESFCQNCKPDHAEVIIAQGEPSSKIILYHKVKEQGYQLANVIHPTAEISVSAQIGSGLIIKRGAVISADAVVEDNVCMEYYALLGHDSIIRAHCQISSLAAIGGHSEIGRGTYIAQSVPVKDNIKIGANSIVGMGAVVLRDIPENVIAMGNPARAMRHKDGSKVFGK